MLDLKLFVEKIYEDKPLTEISSDYIYDYNTRKLNNGIKEFTRYKMDCPESIYDPFKLSRNLLANLSKRITVISNNSIKINTLSDAHLCNNNLNVVICDIPKKAMDEPLITEYGDYTTLGLIAIRLQRHYGDEFFKSRVEEDLEALKFKQNKIGTIKYLMWDRTAPITVFKNMLVTGRVYSLSDVFKWKE